MEYILANNEDEIDEILQSERISDINDTLLTNGLSFHIPIS